MLFFIHVTTALPLCLIIPTEMLVVGKIMEFVEKIGRRYDSTWQEVLYTVS